MSEESGGSYTTYDFEETLKALGDEHPTHIEIVLAGWGCSPEGGGSWEGGFLLKLTDGRFALITGWCDYTGWGCQDGCDVTFSDSRPDIPAGADLEPADLNRWLAEAKAPKA